MSQIREFRSYQQLSQRLAQDAWAIPSDIDAIVGIPRSGLMVAIQLGLIRHLPVCDLESFAKDAPFKFGSTRGQRNDFRERPSECSHIIVVDDSVASGGSLAEAKAELLRAHFKGKVSTYAAYVTAGRADRVDFYGEIVEYPRLFEWNFMHHPLLTNAFLDMDGVICCDPAHDQNDDGEKYLHFMLNAQPRYLPRAKVGTIVSARLARYKEQTISWLKTHGVQYDRLVLLEGYTAEQRRALRINAKYKADIYGRSDATLFIESAEWEASEIAEISGRPVLCTDTMRLLEPTSGFRSVTYNFAKATTTFASRAKARLRRFR
ncbi:phosphoribosyltransferase family protein [Bradyrhizobium sp. UFLA05-112]